MMTPLFAVILHWATRLFGEDVSGRIVAPLLADWSHEQRQTATSWRRGLNTSRWTLALITTAAGVSWRHASPGWRATRVLGLFSAVGTVVLIAPFFQYLPSGSPQAARLAGYLTPQALALAVPFSVLPVAMVLGAAATHVSVGHLRRQLIAVVAGIVLVTGIAVAWVVPEANQAFRDAAGAAVWKPAGSLPRGVRELRIADLWHARGVDPGTARRELHGRAAITLAWPLALAVFGWRLGRHRQSAPWVALLFWWTAAAAIVVVSEPARHTPYLRESPYLVVAAGWCLAALSLRPDRGTSWRPDAPFVRRR
jgi:hypothetical protein